MPSRSAGSITNAIRFRTFSSKRWKHRKAATDMAVYKRNYKRFDGTLTDQRWRFTILPRYAFQTVFESKLLTTYFNLCLLPHMAALVLIYLHYNLGALKFLDIQALQYLEINGNFFLNLLEVETYMSFLLITF